MPEDYEDLKFLADKSAQFIEKQVTAYRQKHSNAGSIITVITLFIPFFLNGLDNAHTIIKVSSIIPVILLIWSIIILINILKTKSLDHGFHTKKFKELVNKKYDEILLYEIGANVSSFQDNEKIISKVNSDYSLVIKLTLTAIIFSSALLLTHKFYYPTKAEETFKVEIVKPKYMNNENNDRDIPQVPPTDRTNLNETFDPKPTSITPPTPSTNDSGKKD